MEDIISALEAQHQAVLVPLPEPSLEDVVNIQEEMQITFPAVLRDWLLQTGTFVVGSIEPVTIADPMSHTHLPEVAAKAWSEGLERTYLPICETHEGLYCMGLDEHIVCWQNGGFTDDYWESLWHWTRDIWLQGDV